MPGALRTDNGSPFAHVGAGGLSRLAVWWIKLGIVPERIEPGRPSQNGRHERMHCTLKAETARPPAATIIAQQQRFDAFRAEYNAERPHESLGQQAPMAWDTPSPRAYPRRLEEPLYTNAEQVRRVRHNGEIRWSQGTIYVSYVLAGEPVGIYDTRDGWLVCYGPLELGWLDPAHNRLRLPKRRPSLLRRGLRNA